jgi:Protein of unknown function (DUF3303)
MRMYKLTISSNKIYYEKVVRMSQIGRWHAPGSAYGWAVVEGNNPTAVAQHIAEWEHLLEFQITPVLEDADAAKALASVYGK